MPTKKQRVGFIPREDVMKIINKLSIENNLSLSKIISILVEEALSLRGVFNKKTGKLTQSYQQIIDEQQELFKNSAAFKVNDKFSDKTKLRNNENLDKTNLSKQINQENYDLQTYKKFISFLKFQEMISELNSQ